MADNEYGPLPIIKSPSEREAEQQAENNRRDRRQRSLQIWFNGLLTIATILTLGTVLYQNYVLEQTLDEMRVQSEAARAQVAEARAQRDLSQRQMAQAAQDAKITQANVAASLDLTREQIQNTKETATNSAMQLSLERPWIDVELRRREYQIPQVTTDPPLVKQRIDGGYLATFLMQVYNRGRSVAASVKIRAAMSFDGQIVRERLQKEACDRPNADVASYELLETDGGDELFLEVPVPQVQTIDIRDGTIRPVVFGCVVYSSSFSGSNYITGFAYVLTFARDLTLTDVPRPTNPAPSAISAWMQPPLIPVLTPEPWGNFAR